MIAAEMTTAPASAARRFAAPTVTRLAPGAQTAAPEPQRPAAVAAARTFALSVLLGVLGLASAVFVITRLFESWRVTSGAPSHYILVFGQRLSYPAANTGAIVVTLLAGLGLLAAGAATWAIMREILGDRRFKQAVAARCPRPLYGAWLIDDDCPQAFCAGLLRPRVYLSTGTVKMLDAPALDAVLAHERHHASRHDPLRLACARALAAGLFYMPALRRLVSRQRALAEISADEAAVMSAGGDRSALAGAILSFSQSGDQLAAGVDPERIDYLIGKRPHWRFPLALCLGAVATLSLLVMLALLAARVGAGSVTLAPPFLSSEPCVAVLAMIPAAAALAGVAYTRMRGQRATGTRLSRRTQ
jgi:Zn-dependent protease with chaperone function